MRKPSTISPVLTAKRYAIARAMFELHKGGLSIGEVAAHYSVTRTAITRRLKKFGFPIFAVNDPAGGKGLAVARSRAAQSAAREARANKKWGCSVAQYIELQKMYRPTRTFHAQRNQALSRGVGWELNLWQWWTIWQESGHWDRRGRGQGYVMCRYGDVGPYAVDNVFIAPGIVNCSDKAAKQSGLPIGVIARRNKFLAIRMVGGKLHRLGAHETPELAHAAYLSLGPIGAA